MDGGSDRISDLPDHLLSRILSLLPFDCAVATCVLSTRWKFLWTSITNFSFEYCEHFSERQNVTTKKNKFTCLVNKVLLLPKPLSIQNLYLDCMDAYFDQTLLNSWISAAFWRTIGELDLSLPEHTELCLSRIRCNAVVLKLNGEIHFNIPAAAAAQVYVPSLQTLHLGGITVTIAENSSVCFPNVKILHLKYVHYESEDSIHKLLSSCPSLEDLVIESEFLDDASSLIISIPSLTRLSLAFITEFADRPSPPCKVHINTPTLQYLCLRDNLQCEYFVVNLDSLIQAEVEVYGICAEDMESCTNIFTKFIESICKVKSLSLFGESPSILGLALKAIIASPNTSSHFHNLTWLSLEEESCIGMSVVNSFLGRMDNLKHLFMKGLNCNCSKQSWWAEPLNVPKCLSSRIFTISFTFPRSGRCDQLELLRYFLRNALALQRLKISTSYLSENARESLQEKIVRFPRGSRTCQIVFTDEFLPPWLPSLIY